MNETEHEVPVSYLIDEGKTRKLKIDIVYALRRKMVLKIFVITYFLWLQKHKKQLEM